jgi:CTP synthase (UTP-ammonia lyase)
MDALKDKGLKIVGVSPKTGLVEIIELPDHPWFVGCQFHPEFKSRPMAPHPLFVRFIQAAVKHAKMRNWKGQKAGTPQADEAPEESLPKTAKSS